MYYIFYSGTDKDARARAERRRRGGYVLRAMAQMALPVKAINPLNFNVGCVI
jgi:hypothetical protein